MSSEVDGTVASIVTALVLIVAIFLWRVYAKLPSSILTADVKPKSRHPKDLVVFAEATEKHAKKYDRSVEELFSSCDADGDGRVTKQELKNAVKKLPYLMEELGLKRLKDVSKFMEDADRDNDRRLSLQEFRAFLARVENAVDVDAERRAALVCSESDLEKIVACLKAMTAGAGGRGVTAAELAHGYSDLAKRRGRPIAAERAGRYAAKAFRKYDVDGNGRISLEEFIPMCLRGPFLGIFEPHKN
jgi:Ca2+-binding EF-hand superfamily protein